MSEAANSGQDSTQTVTDDANVATGQPDATPAGGNKDDDQAAAAGGDKSAPAPEGQTTDDEASKPNADDKPAEDEDDKAKDGDKAGEVPEKYEFKAPEGVALNEELVGEFSELAKELKLSQDDAQKVVDLGPKIMQKFADQQAQTIVDAQTAWAAESKTDTEFGGDKLAENLAVSKQALDAYGTDKLKTLLVDSGLGNHPEVIRVFYRIGKELNADGLVTGRQSGSTPKTLADRLYGNTSK